MSFISNKNKTFFFNVLQTAWPLPCGDWGSHGYYVLVPYGAKKDTVARIHVGKFSQSSWDDDRAPISLTSDELVTFPFIFSGSPQEFMERFVTQDVDLNMVKRKISRQDGDHFDMVRTFYRIFAKWFTSGMPVDFSAGTLVNHPCTRGEPAVLSRSVQDHNRPSLHIMSPANDLAGNPRATVRLPWMYKWVHGLKNEETLTPDQLKDLGTRIARLVRPKGKVRVMDVPVPINHYPPESFPALLNAMIDMDVHSNVNSDVNRVAP